MAKEPIGMDIGRLSDDADLVMGLVQSQIVATTTNLEGLTSPELRHVSVDVVFALDDEGRSWRSMGGRRMASVA